MQYHTYRTDNSNLNIALNKIMQNVDKTHPLLLTGNNLQWHNNKTISIESKTDKTTKNAQGK